HTDRFKTAGGTVTIEKQEIPGFGWSVMGLDPEGNLVGLFQPTQPVRPARASPSRKKSASKTKKSSSKSKKKSRR
ncbi:MAG: VOC family protein, partial [Nitrososphaerales archaeon]